MQINFDEELTELTDDEITNGVANPVFQTNFHSLNFMSVATVSDYFVRCGAVIEKYIYLSGPFDDRINSLLFHNDLFVTEGNYKYNINYRLPDRTITSSYSYDMPLDFNYYGG